VSTEPILHWRSKTNSRTEPNLKAQGLRFKNRLTALVKRCENFHSESNKTVLL